MLLAGIFIGFSFHVHLFLPHPRVLFSHFGRCTVGSDAAALAGCDCMLYSCAHSAHMGPTKIPPQLLQLMRDRFLLGVLVL